MTPTPGRHDDFPLLYARSQRGTLGRPRGFVVSPDGGAVWFLRSDTGDDPVHHLWRHDVHAGTTTRVADARHLDSTREPTAAERARRERAREGGGGIVAFATDRAANLACFVDGGRAHVVDAAGTVVPVDAPDGAHDPRLAPDGDRIALVVGRTLHAGTVPLRDGLLEPGAAVATAPMVGPGPDEDAVTFGLAEFVAAEELGRMRGFWWSPDGSHLLVARVDESAVATAWLGDPVDPTTRPRPHRYPFAGTTDATVDLVLVPIERDGRSLVAGPAVPVDGARDHYLAAVTWSAERPALVAWLDRPQSRMTVTALDVEAATTVVRSVHASDHWVMRAPGTPAWAGDAIVTVEPLAGLGPEGSHALVVDGDPVSPPGLQVRSVVDVRADRAVLTCTRGDATSVEVVALDLATGAVSDLVAGPGVHAVHVGGTTRVEVSTTMDRPVRATVVAGERRRDLADHAVELPDDPRVVLHELADGLRAGVVVPVGDGPFPVLLDPYGGPGSQRVVQAHGAWALPRWFARNGIAVVVVDNHGAPGRSPAFEWSIAGDLATAPLRDQVAAVDEVVAADERLDGTRLAIRGWSFGGYVAGLAAIRRPDRFRAAIVGAPVTDWRLYDTAYTERYLGHPDEHPDAYRWSSLVDEDGGLVEAAPSDDATAIMLIHGMVDDNVVPAHSLRLSRALLEAGRPHRFLPLSGVSHMTPQATVTANLLTDQLAFLQAHLGGA